MEKELYIALELPLVSGLGRDPVVKTNFSVHHWPFMRSEVQFQYKGILGTPIVILIIMATHSCRQLSEESDLSVIPAIRTTVPCFDIYTRDWRTHRL